MPSYTSPTPQDVLDRAGISVDAEGLTTGALNARLAIQITDAEFRTARSVGEDLFASGTLTAAQVGMLRRSVCLRAQAGYWLILEGEKASGTNEPLNMEDVTSWRNVADNLERQAEELDFRVRVPTVQPDLSNAREQYTILSKQLQLGRDTGVPQF